MICIKISHTRRNNTNVREIYIAYNNYIRNVLPSFLPSIYFFLYISRLTFIHLFIYCFGERYKQTLLHLEMRLITRALV